MIRLSKKSGLFPKCLALHDVEKYGDYPVAVGGFGEIWKGTYAGQSVCIKVLKTYSESEVTPRLVKVSAERYSQGLPLIKCRHF